MSLTRDEIAPLVEDFVFETVEGPTGLEIEMLTTDGTGVSISRWNGVLVVTIPATVRGMDSEFDGFDTLAQALEFAQGFAWEDYA